MRRLFFTDRVFWSWMLYSLVGAILIYYVPAHMTEHTFDVVKGGSADVWELGAICFSACVVSTLMSNRIIIIELTVFYC